MITESPSTAATVPTMAANEQLDPSAILTPVQHARAGADQRLRRAQIGAPITAVMARRRTPANGAASRRVGTGADRGRSRGCSTRSCERHRCRSATVRQDGGARRPQSEGQRIDDATRHDGHGVGRRAPSGGSWRLMPRFRVGRDGCHARSTSVMGQARGAVSCAAVAQLSVSPAGADRRGRCGSVPQSASSHAGDVSDRADNHDGAHGEPESQDQP